MGLWWSSGGAGFAACGTGAGCLLPSSTQEVQRRKPQPHERGSLHTTAPLGGTELEFQPQLATSPDCIHLFINGTWEHEMQTGWDGGHPTMLAHHHCDQLVTQQDRGSHHPPIILSPFLLSFLPFHACIHPSVIHPSSSIIHPSTAGRPECWRGWGQV